jgi:hypothetical protein
MDTVVGIDQLQSMLTVAVIISIGILGFVQWIKNIHLIYRRDLKYCCEKTALITMLVAVIMGYLNSPIGLERFDGWVQVIDTILLVLAVTQLCWDILAKGLPRIVGSLIDRFAGAPRRDPSGAGKNNEGVEG